MYADECKCDAIEQIHVGRSNDDIVRDDPSMHLRVDFFEIVDLLRRLSELINGWSTRSAERVVLEKIIVIEQSNFPDRRFCYEIKYVRPSSTEPNDPDFFDRQSITKRAYACAI